MEAPASLVQDPLDQAKLQEKLHTVSPGIGTRTSTITTATLVWTLKWGRATWLQSHTDVVWIMVSSEPSYTLPGEARGKIFCQNEGINQERDLPRKWGSSTGQDAGYPPGELCGCAQAQKAPGQKGQVSRQEALCRRRRVGPGAISCFIKWVRLRDLTGWGEE